MSDALILAALSAGVIRADPLTGMVTGTRWASSLDRGTLNQHGYVVFTLHFDGSRCQAKSHRVVWLSVHGSIPHDMMIDHVNGNKSDNRLANLRLASAKLNSNNRRSYNGEQNPSAKINANTVLNIREAYDALKSYARVAEQFGVSKSLVAQIIRRELWN